MRLFFIIPSVLVFAGCRNSGGHGGGLLLPQKDSIKTIPWAASAGRVTDLPPAVDMQPNLPPTGDQGDQGACVAWALGYNLASYYEKSFAHLSDYHVVNGTPDPNRVYSPALIYNYLKQSVIPEECKTGIAYKTAFDFIRSNGVCTWNDLPYMQDIESCKAQIPTTALTNSRLHAGYNFERINNTVNDIKLYASLGLPVIVGLFTSANLYDQGKGITPGHLFLWAPDKNDRAEYHAMLIVGYDSLNFKLMNSWGNDWGANGYVLIPYKNLLDRTLELYICKKNVDVVAAASAAATIDLDTVANRTVAKLLPDSSILQFNNASICMVIPDTGKEQVLFKFSDSTSGANGYEGIIGSNEEKQVYLKDKRVTIKMKNARRKKKRIDLQLVVDKGGLDQDVLRIDSSMQSIYSYLRAKKSPTDVDKALLEEFDSWSSGYHRHIATGRQGWRIWVEWAASLAGAFIAALVGVRVFRRKKRD